MRLLLFLIPLIACANIIELPKTYTYLEAMKACKKVGPTYRILEIWELFALRGKTNRFGKDKLYWSGNTLGEARIEKNIRHESEIFVLDKDIPAFAFYLQDGDITPTPKSTKAHVLCTDQPKHHQLDTEFKKMPNGMVYDAKNRVFWEPYDAKRDRLKLSFEKAKAYCENLHLFGRRWRLPDLDELYSIVNYNYVKPALNKEIFGHMHHKYYVTDEEFGEDKVYVVGFAVGSVATAPKHERFFFRCVSDADEVAGVYGVLTVYDEALQIIQSEASMRQKLQKLLHLVRAFRVDQKTARLIYQFCTSVKKYQKLKKEVLDAIRLRQSGLA